MSLTSFLVLTLILIGTTSSILLDIRYPKFFPISSVDSAVEIAEGKSSGSFIAFLTILNGTFDEWALNCSDDDFEIIFNGISHSLVTRKILDRERKNFYEFVVTARHLIYPFEKLSRTIRLRILDLNDSPPKFNQTIYRTSLVPQRTTFTVRAFDDDQIDTMNSRISYSLANYNEIFRINETTGTIECLKIPQSTFDRYEIIVEARDHGKPSLKSTTLVQIQLLRPAPSLPSSRSSFFIEQRPENMLIVTGILAAIFLVVCLFTCLICSIHYKIKRRNSMMRKTPNSPPIHLYLPENVNNSNNNNELYPICSCDSSDQPSNPYLLLNYSSLSPSSPSASFV